MFHVVNKREVQGTSERHVRKAISSNVQVLQRMCLQRTLQGHVGCVNTCSFDTEGGSILITGSDDRQIFLWDWQRGTTRLRFVSGHRNNVFQARMLPHTGGTRIVTCAADGQVRLAELPEGASSVSVSIALLASHAGRAHKIALDPLNPQHCFYSSGEDGQVMHFDLRCGTGARQSSSSSSGSSRSGARRKLLICRGYSRTRGPTTRVIGLNAIHVNPTRPWQFAVGGDDAWARVYDVRKTRDLPNPALQNQNSSGSSQSASSLAAVAAAAAAAVGFRDGSSNDSTAAAAAAATTIGPPTRQEARDSRVYAMTDEPIVRLCPDGLNTEGGRGYIGSMGPSITCVMFSKQGELLASYNDEDIYLYSPQASAGCLTRGSSSSSYLSKMTAAAAATQSGGGTPGSSNRQPPQQLQQQQTSSFLRRARTAAAAAQEDDEEAGMITDEQQQQQQWQRQLYYEAEEEDRPRWRRRQRLRSAGEMEATAAAASPPAGPTAAAAAAGLVDVSAAAAAGGGPQRILAPGTAMDVVEGMPPPATAAANGSAAAGAAQVSSTPAAAAASGPHSLVGAVIVDDAVDTQRAINSIQTQQQQQQQQQGLAGPPACGLGRGFGMPAARFYDLNSSSRDGVVASYYGHRNAATVKGVSFFGEDDEYIMSGSDCGHVYVWSKAVGEVVWWQPADDEVVNCLEPHPLMPHVLATSGIEHDVKIWAPSAARPSPPQPASLRATMAANKRDRDAQRDVMSEPEQWLLQLLAAQRRRAAAAARTRRLQAAATATAGTAHAAATATEADVAPPPAEPATAGDAPVDGDGMEAVGSEAPQGFASGDDDEEHEDVDAFARFVLPGGGRVVRVRFAGGRRMGRDDTARPEDDQANDYEMENDDDAETSDVEQEEDGSEAAEEEEEEEEEEDDRPCYVS